MNLGLLTDWMPIRVYQEQGEPMLDWAYFGSARFVEPFFEDTVAKVLRRPFSLLFRHQTPISILDELQVLAPGVAPTGFIFHMSRCGSTLVSQMMAALPQNIVIAEAGPIDAVLRIGQDDPQITAAQRIGWLRGLLSAYARPRAAQEHHFFVKFDSWHTLHLPLIQRAFPDVPWIFLYREPAQVLASHARQPGAQMAPGLLDPRALGLDEAALVDIPPGGFCARVLAAICQAALQYRNARALFVNYCQLPGAAWATIAAHFQVDFSAADRDAMRQVAQFDAKTPGLYFTQTITGDIRTGPTASQLAEQWLMLVYAALETR